MSQSNTMSNFKSIILNDGRVVQYMIVRDNTGERFVKTPDGLVIPADIAALFVDDNDWMREIKCKCRDCGQLFPLKDLEGGGQWCEPCATKDIMD